MIQFLRNNAKVVAIVILVFFVATMGSGTFFLAKSRHSDSNNNHPSTFATIGNIPIDDAKFKETVQYSLAQLGAQPNRSIPPEYIETIQMQALQQAAQYSLLLNAAHAQGLSVSRSERKAALQSVYKQYGFKNKGELKKKLSEINYPYDAFIARIENDIKVQKLLAQIKSQITVTDKDVENKYTQIHARHILIALSATTNAEAAEKKASDILAQIKKGLPFEQAAKQFSDDPSNKTSGGDLGWFGTGKMVIPFEDAAFALDKDELSTPIQTEFGYHLIQVLDRREIARPANIDIETEKKNLLAEKQSRKVSEFLAEISANQEIVVHDPELNATYQKFRGNIPGALALYQQMISQNPSATYAHYLLANTYYMTGDSTNAIKQLEIADIKATASPQFDSPYIHLFLGRLYSQSNRPADAQSQYDKALTLGAKDLTVLTQLKSVYTESKNTAKVLEIEAALLKVQAEAQAVTGSSTTANK